MPTCERSMCECITQDTSTLPGIWRAGLLQTLHPVA